VSKPTHGGMQVAADADIRPLHERHAPTPEALNVVYTHCVIVCEIAEHLHARSGVDADMRLVRAGSQLHDVVVYRLYDVGQLDHASCIRHGCSGTSCSGKKGFPK
jgi:uncharacterized protein